MSESARPARTTVLVGLLLALLLVVAYAVSRWAGTVPEPAATPTATGPPFPTAPSQTPPPGTPTTGADYPVRKVGALRDDRSLLLNGRGNADLRYRRAPHNGTRLHFICTGCDTDTWLVEQPRGYPVGGGPLRDPADVTWALDTVGPGRTTDLLVRAPAGARWTVTLTPFDAIPVHERTFDTLGDDVVAVRSRGDLRLSCGGALFLENLARGTLDVEYVVVEVREQDQPGRWPVAAPTETDLTILMVSCPGRWTITFL
jgi:hypothetical protein